MIRSLFLVLAILAGAVVPAHAHGRGHSHHPGNHHHGHHHHGHHHFHHFGSVLVVPFFYDPYFYYPYPCPYPIYSPPVVAEPPPAVYQQRPFSVKW